MITSKKMETTDFHHLRQCRGAQDMQNLKIREKTKKIIGTHKKQLFSDSGVFCLKEEGKLSDKYKNSHGDHD